MSAITMQDCLAAVRGEKCPVEARRCVKGLVNAARTDIPGLSDKRSLRAAHSALLEDQSRGWGRLIVDVIRTGPKALPGFIELVAPTQKDKALDIYADAYLLLGDWVVLWNRRQLRKVA